MVCFFHQKKHFYLTIIKKHHWSLIATGCHIEEDRGDEGRDNGRVDGHRLVSIIQKPFSSNPDFCLF
jgi:hypothetical protein